MSLVDVGTDHKGVFTLGASLGKFNARPVATMYWRFAKRNPAASSKSSGSCLEGKRISNCSCASSRTSLRLSFALFFNQDSCSFDKRQGRLTIRLIAMCAA